jgi:glycosyltransferase involved in cell wall biosynthesis
VGDGRDRTWLENQAPKNVAFVGWKAGTDLASLYSRATALLFPSEDDFGLTPIEANACGTPVIAYAGGGALDTITEGQNGTFFSEASTESLRSALRRFDAMKFDRSHIAASTRGRYSNDAFASAIQEVVSRWSR